MLYRYQLGTLVAVLGLVHLGASVLAAQERENIPAAPPAAPLPMAQAWDTSYVVLLESNADYRPASQEAVQATVQAHLQYQLRLIAEGRTVMGGPLVRADVMVERMWDPTVQVHGAIATLWAPYDFYVNHTFSHCGVNAVQLIRSAEGWRVANWIWTVEPEGCAPSPLGPVREDQR